MAQADGCRLAYNYIPAEANALPHEGGTCYYDTFKHTTCMTAVLCCAGWGATPIGG